ncbi:DUF1134 domain-containing protein [Paucibacter sp. R3-3]|uniref:DUF1134 domain-containing protein n=1 Tax=Roseateles agri TaxID=3098619 RepID=A0ABU5DCN8_9BURK|nr:DUF1134 domain-containing protein [Paucibacter sp. R3-3]MDY0744037.1 DUF1134 domain-containing protein [Paucibacter sp. R3-3]
MQDKLTVDLIERRATIARLAALAAGAGLPALALAADDKEDDKTYDEDSVLKAATEFFGDTTEGLAKVIAKAFQEQGRPNAYIKGQEASGALTVGLRYGEGELLMKGSARGAKVYWAGPSIGFDAGGNASKVFTLVYHLPKASAIYQRFPGVDGSLYYVGGAGINYQRRNGITLAPIRLGVGLRAGASVGYLHYRREKSVNPF